MKTITSISIRVALILAIFLVGSYDADAQCAMCKAVAEDTMQDGFGVAMGLNYGILFIMFIPYVLLTVLFFTFFRKRIMGFFREFSNIH